MQTENTKSDSTEFLEHYSKLALGIICEEIPESLAIEFIPFCVKNLTFEEVKRYGGEDNSIEELRKLPEDSSKKAQFPKPASGKKKICEPKQNNTLDNFFKPKPKS